MKHWIFFMALMAVAVSCSTSAPTQNRSLNLAMQAEPPSLHPGIGGVRQAQIVISMLFDQLMRYDEAGALQTSVAEKVEVSSDYKHYTFHLRESQWSNGMDVTAEDFAFAWKSVIDPQSESLYGYAFYPIKNAEAAKVGQVSLEEVGIYVKDAQTLVVELEKPSPYFLELTANPVYSPICKKMVEQHPDWAKGNCEKFVSNGPFSLRSYQPGARLEVEKNALYWDQEQVRLPGVNISFVSSAETNLASFELGEMDFIGGPLCELPLSALPSLIEAGKLESVPSGGLFWYMFNTQKAPFSHPKFRKALAYALDRESLAEHIFHGRAQVAQGVVPTSLKEHPTSMPEYDLEMAHHLLNEALEEMGWSKEQLPAVTLSYGDVEGQKVLAQAVQQQWIRGLGIPVNLQSAEWQVHLNSLWEGEFDVGGVYWYSWYRDPLYNLQPFRSLSNRMNSPSWYDESFASLMEASDWEGDRAKRARLLEQAENRLIDQMPLCPAFATAYHFLKDPALKGVVISDLGQFDIKWAYFGT